jgi:hypothetical protein
VPLLTYLLVGCPSVLCPDPRERGPAPTPESEALAQTSVPELSKGSRAPGVLLSQGGRWMMEPVHNAACPILGE